MKPFVHSSGRVRLQRAWTGGEVTAAVEDVLVAREGLLPSAKSARIVIKPNLNNDLVALTGNCVDLRVLSALVRGLQRRGYTDLTVADGANVGMARRGLDGFKRLRVDKFCQWLGVRLVDLNADDGDRVVLHRGGWPRVARTVLEQDFLISIPKIKTHAEMQLTCAMKNWVGICVGQDKRHVHYDLGRNIYALNEAVRPDLVLVDGLVGMEGNGPGDGEPFRLGLLLDGDDTLLTDLVVCRLVDMPWREVPYLAEAGRLGRISAQLEERLLEEVPLLRPIKRPPPRSRLAVLSEHRGLLWLKLLVRPLVNRPAVARAAYRARIIQDVYDSRDDTLRVVGRQAGSCADCTRCADFCPTDLALERIGQDTELPDCIQCLYCWFVCPRDAIQLDGERRHLSRQVERYGPAIKEL